MESSITMLEKQDEETPSKIPAALAQDDENIPAGPSEHPERAAIHSQHPPNESPNPIHQSQIEQPTALLVTETASPLSQSTTSIPDQDVHIPPGPSNDNAQVSSFDTAQIISSEQPAKDEPSSQNNNSSSSEKNSPNVGSKTKGTIKGFENDLVIVQLENSIETKIEKREFSNARKDTNLEIGNVIDLFVVTNQDQQITVRLSPPTNKSDDLRRKFQHALDTQETLEGKVIGRNKGGLEVRIFGKRTFCPTSLIELRYCDNLEQYVGQTLSFKVIEIRENGRQIVISRKAILEKSAKQHEESIKEQLQSGAIFSGHITSLTEYGAFVAIGGGIEGLVHVSEISHQRVRHPNEVLKKGQEVKVKVLKYDPSHNRISLSMKSLEQDPWTEVLSQFPEDAIVEGKIVRLEAFGAFVELKPGIDGLIHISELSPQRIQHPSEIVSVGQIVHIRVIRNEAEKHRIGLSMKEFTKQTSSNDEKRARKPISRRQSTNTTTAKQKNSQKKVFGTLADLLKNVKIDQ